MVLDDGAYFLEALASAGAEDLFEEGELCLVEQTARGIIKINADASGKMKALAAKYPLVSVAESRAKKGSLSYP